MSYKVNSPEILKDAAQKKLMILWFVLSGLLILLFMVLTILGRFEDKSIKAWEWLSQNVVPTVTLMAGAMFSSIMRPSSKTLIDRSLFRVTYGLSIFYLTTLYLTILLAPFAMIYTHLSMIDLFEQSKLYLVIPQGIVSLTIGMFFYNKS